MIANVSAHRRANAFARALADQQERSAPQSRPGAAEHAAPSVPDPGGPAPAASSAAYRADDPHEGDPQDTESRSPQGGITDLARLAAVVDGLRGLPVPRLDPEVRVAQRARLVAAMETTAAEEPGDRRRPVPGQRSGRGTHRAGPLHKLTSGLRLSKGLAAGGLTVGVAAGAFSGVAAASSNALPGDSLYGLKRGMEDLKLGMAGSASDRGEIYLDHASTRMHEARRLMERSPSRSYDHEFLGEVRRALSGVRHDASEGHRLLHEAYEHDGSLGPIRTLDAFSHAHRDHWRQLRDRLPVQLTDVRDEVTSVFDAMDEEVGPLKSLLPAPSDGDRNGSGTSESEEPGHRSHRASPSSSPSDDPSPRSGKPRPSASREADKGLIGGAGDLLHPPAPGGSGPSGKNGGVPRPDITLPPLFPGLLPGLGIDGDDGP